MPANIDPPRLIEPERLRLIRHHLTDVGYTFDAVLSVRHGLFTAAESPAGGIPEPGIALFRRRWGLSEVEPAAPPGARVLMDLFWWGRGIAEPVVRDVLGRDALAALRDAGLVVRRGADLVAELPVLACGDLFLVTDRHELNRAVNQVMWLFPDTYLLASVTDRTRVRRVLDLCTGSGVHALLAAAHSELALGVDVNPRALAFAEFNRALNAVDGARFARGDLWTAAAGQGPFDLIVANPPFNPVLDSAAGDNFYSGGPSGEEILSRIVGGLAEHLAPGGRCQIVTLFVHRRDEPYEGKLAAWLGPRAGEFQATLFTMENERWYSVPRMLEGAALTDRAALEGHWDGQGITHFEFGLIDVRRAATPAAATGRAPRVERTPLMAAFL